AELVLSIGTKTKQIGFLYTNQVGKLGRAKVFLSGFFAGVGIVVLLYAVFFKQRVENILVFPLFQVLLGVHFELQTGGIGITRGCYSTNIHFYFPGLFGILGKAGGG